MESLLSRYRSLSVLLAVMLAQLVAVAYQVRTGNDIPLLRVWAVSLAAPPGKAIEAVGSALNRWWTDYWALVGVRQENRRLAQELDRLRQENRFLRSELASAERAQALALFRPRIASETIGARVIGAAAGVNSQVVFVDRGASSGVRTGMAVINAAGLAGKVVAVYPSVSQVMLVTAEGFSAGVISVRTGVQGILRGLGRRECSVAHVHSDEDVQVGDWFYTSGEDRIFPRGLPAGQVKSVGGGGVFRDIVLMPAAMERGFEELLIVTAPVHQALPEEPPIALNAPLLPPPGAASAPAAGPSRESTSALLTDADRVLEQHRRTAAGSGAAQADREAAAGERPAPAPPKPAPVKP